MIKASEANSIALRKGAQEAKIKKTIEYLEEVILTNSNIGLTEARFNLDNDLKALAIDVLQKAGYKTQLTAERTLYVKW